MAAVVLPKLLWLCESNRTQSTKLKATYLLAQEIERQGDTNSEAEYQQLMQKILTAQPNNLAALLELGRVAAKRGDAETLRNTITQHRCAILIMAAGGSGTAECSLRLLLPRPDPRGAATRIIFLRNVMVRVSEFRESLAAIKPPAGEEATPFTHFLSLESPTFAAAPADTTLTFKQRPVTNVDGNNWNWIGGVSLGSEGAPTVFVANSKKYVWLRAHRFHFLAGRQHSALHFQREFCQSILSTISRPTWCSPAVVACG